MTDHDAVPFLRALSAVAEIFERDLSDAAQTLYFDTLKDLPIGGCLRALEAAARQNTFMPRPSELRRLVVGGFTDPESGVEAAWQEYKQLARTVGGYASVTIADAALAETLLALFDSWEGACFTEQSPEMWAATRKAFGRIYRLMGERDLRGSRTLDGFCARRNVERYGRVDPREVLPAAEDGGAMLPAHHVRGLFPAPVPSVDIEALRERWRQRVAMAIAAHHDAHPTDGSPEPTP